MELLEEYVTDLKNNYDFSFYKFFEKVKELKETEKQQIIDAIEYDTEESYTSTLTGEQYYKQTYTTNKETLK